MDIKDIPEAVVRRLPVYYRNICYMEAEGIEKTTSIMIAKRAGNTSTQVRQDFYMCGGIDNYKIPELKAKLRNLLGVNQKHNMVIVGGGNLGRALASYKEFENEGFFINAIFDNNLSLCEMQINGIPIINSKLFDEYLSQNKTDIVVIATPANVAESIMEKAVAGNVKGIWNFAPVDLRSCGRTKVQNVHLGDSLLTLSLMTTDLSDVLNKKPEKGEMKNV